jgi:hypothetical protein
MRASRVAAIAVTCAAILTAGYVAAPEPVPALQLVTPVTTTDAESDTP